MRIYVGNIPYKMTDEDLKNLFAAHGAVASANIVTDRETGRSRGFGFVDMENHEEAQKAIEALNETEHDGRALVVNEARPRKERGDRGGRGRGRDDDY